MAYKVKCVTCDAQSRITQARGVRMKDYKCPCGGALRRISWQEMYQKSGRRQSAAQVAASLLRETGNPAIGWGDSGLLHQVADMLGMPHEGPRSERKVLDRIERSHQGVLEKRHVEVGGRYGNVRQFMLPEKSEELIAKTQTRE